MKPKVAFFDFTSCEGCQLTVVDSLQTHVDLLDVVEIVQFREAMTEKGEDYLVAFVEGLDQPRERRSTAEGIRERAAVLVALGACAHLGGVNSIRNAMPLEDVRQYVYGDKAHWYETYPARPLSAVVKVDSVHPRLPHRPRGVHRGRQGAAGGSQAADPGLPAVRRVQAQRKRLHVRPRRAMPGAGHARRLRRDLPDVWRRLRGLSWPDPRPEQRSDERRSREERPHRGRYAGALVDVRDVSADGVGGEEVMRARNRQTSSVKRQCVERCAYPIITFDARHFVGPRRQVWVM